MKWIGLTGGIATGKSTAKKLIEGLGIPVIDADLISHQVTAAGAEGLRQVVFHFGNEILNPDQSLNRKKLGSIIFADIDHRLKLENILHPLIQAKVQKLKMQYQAAGHQICFYDVPLLFEKNLEKLFDRVVLIWCDRQEQLTRLMLRNQFSPEEAELRINSQTLMCEKVRHAHYCVDNSTDLDSLEIQINYLIKTLG
ncbi:MAG: dephospho-CoA kinase [Bdellovibrio sp.]|nr:dephospho-CoA kinase [Bdellovibrio sp.]